jgi:choline dehydrogenase/5'-oxoaverantin cyclase/versicolorin B synthase
MWLHRVCFSAPVLAASKLFTESFQAQGLLGSHFGVPGLSATYDYVIIGGGTAGLTVARRLAANSSITVAIIEAGDFYEFSNGNLSEIPAFTSEFTGNNPTQKNPYLDWYMYTEPQPVSSFLFFPRKIPRRFFRW